MYETDVQQASCSRHIIDTRAHLFSWPSIQSLPALVCRRVPALLATSKSSCGWMPAPTRTCPCFGSSASASPGATACTALKCESELVNLTATGWHAVPWVTQMESLQMSLHWPAGSTAQRNTRYALRQSKCRPAKASESQQLEQRQGLRVEEADKRSAGLPRCCLTVSALLQGGG